MLINFVAEFGARERVVCMPCPALHLVCGDERASGDGTIFTVRLRGLTIRLALVPDASEETFRRKSFG